MCYHARVEASERRAEVEELERQLAKLAIAKKDAESAEKLAEVTVAERGCDCLRTPGM